MSDRPTLWQLFVKWEGGFGGPPWIGALWWAGLFGTGLLVVVILVLHVAGIIP